MENSKNRTNHLLFVKSSISSASKYSPFNNINLAKPYFDLKKTFFVFIQISLYTRSMSNKLPASLDLQYHHGRLPPTPSLQRQWRTNLISWIDKDNYIVIDYGNYVYCHHANLQSCFSQFSTSKSVSINWM